MEFSLFSIAEALSINKIKDLRNVIKILEPVATAANNCLTTTCYGSIVSNLLGTMASLPKIKFSTQSSLRLFVYFPESEPPPSNALTLNSKTSIFTLIWISQYFLPQRSKESLAFYDCANTVFSSSRHFHFRFHRHCHRHFHISIFPCFHIHIHIHIHSHIYRYRTVQCSTLLLREPPSNPLVEVIKIIELLTTISTNCSTAHHY